MRVQRCFSFSDTNNTVALLDERGCPIRRIISDFRYDLAKGTAEATVYSMFKFPDSHRVHIQCDILVCPGKDSDPKMGGLYSGRHWIRISASRN